MLTELAELFGGQVASHWATDMDNWGERVALYRQYVNGEHRVYLTQTMQKMLNVTGKKHVTFSADYTDMVVRMMSERLVVKRIEAMAPHDMEGGENADEVNLGQVWVDDLLKKNRFDGLQMDVHESAVRDSDAFVIVDYDDQRQCARFNFNLAWDGDVGVLPIYARSEPHKMLAAVKIFYVDATQKQATVYYKDRVLNYQTDAKGSGFTPMDVNEEGSTWLAGVVPVVQFSNRRRSGSSVGVSEVMKAISLQDILNRTLVSMVMASEMSAFQILFARGFKVPPDVAPGAVVAFENENPAILAAADLKAIPQAVLTAFIEQINKVIDLVAEVTQTPIASSMGGANQSGEALKQREAGLLTKLQGFHVKGGNAWEDLMMVAHAVETAYKPINKPPAIEMFDCKWKDAAIRSDTEVAGIADRVFANLQNKPLYLEMMAEITGWDATKRQQILDDEARLSAAAMRMSGFGNVLGAAGEFGLTLNGVS